METFAPREADGDVYDAETPADLAGIFGEARLAELLAGLDEEIVRRLDGAAPADADLGGNAHALVSVSGTLGFSALSRACERLERASLDGADLSGPLREAQDEAARARRAIAALRGAGS